MKTKRGAIMKEEKSGEVAKLKRHIKRLESDKKRLISEIKTLEKVLEQNFKVLKGTIEDLTVEDLIEAAKENKTIKEVKDIKETCPNCKSEVRPMITRFGKLITCKDCGYKSKRNE